MSNFGIFKGFSDKLFEGELPTQLGGIGSGVFSDSFQFTINTNNTSTGSTTNTQFKLPLVSSLTLNFIVDWGDNTTDTITTWNQAQTTHTYASAGTYTIKITGQISGWQFNNTGDRLKILNISNWGALNISVSAGFYGCTNLTCSATDIPIISTTTLDNYFRACTNFNGVINEWNVSSVTSMIAVFAFTAAFNQNISSWNTSAVTNMVSMFQNALSFNQNIESWNVSAVTIMQNMFAFAPAFNQNIGSWNVSNVTNFTNFMAGKTAANYSAANLDAIYNRWSSRPVKPNITISFNTIKYTAASSAGRLILTSAPNNWTITDGGI